MTSQRHVSVPHDAEDKMPTGLLRRGARYYLRRRVPEDLRGHFAKTEIVYSLRTADPRLARERLAVEWVSLDEQFRELRAERKPLSATPDVTGGGLDAWPANVSQDEFEDWIRCDDEQNADMAREEAEYEARESARTLARKWLDGSPHNLSHERLAVRDILKAQTFELDVARDRLAALVLNAPVETKAVPKPVTASVSVDDRKLSDIVDEWGREREVRAKGIADHVSIARWFEDRAGPLLVANITRQHIIEFKNKLRDEGQSQSNVKVKLSRLRTLLGYAMANGYRSDNPAVGVVITIKDADRLKRRSFDPLSLESIFTSPVYKTPERPKAGRGEAAYWLPLLGLYTGARLEELGQLRVADVVAESYLAKNDEVATSWFLRITEDEDDGLKLKNAGSARLVPVHRVLEECNFLDYVEQMRELGHSRLFPLLKADKYGRVTAKWGEWFSKYRRDVCGVTDRRLVFHSFRHTFKDCCRHAGLEEGVQRQLMGHSPGDVAGSYGSGYSQYQLVAAMQKYRVPGFKPPALIHS